MSDFKRYIVKKIYKYSEEVEVFSISREEAKRFALTVDGERNHDDYLYDTEVYEPKDQS